MESKLKLSKDQKKALGKYATSLFSEYDEKHWRRLIGVDETHFDENLKT